MVHEGNSMAKRGAQSKGTREKTTPRVKGELDGHALNGPTTDGAIGGEALYQMIAEAAYYRAEQRGFAGGDPVRDWLEAEAEVSVKLGPTGARVQGGLSGA
jgi:hypothetical protein